jgi:malonate transporter
MASVAASLIPTFLLVLLGAAMRRTRWFPDPFWIALDRLVYFVCFPVLLFRSLGSARLGADLAPFGLALLAGIFLVTALLLALRRVVAADGPGFTSVYQGAVRFSTFVGLGSVAALHGQAGIGIFAFAIAVCVPTLNLLCVIVLARFGGHQEPVRAARLLRQIASNPLILACLAGIALNLSGLALPLPLDRTLEALDRAALPLGLLAVGAGLDFRMLGSIGRPVLASSLLRLVALPVLVYAACMLLGVDGLARSVAVLWAALPTASSAYILARQMGGDAPLMAAIVTAQTLLAFATMPVMLSLLG